MSSQIHVAIRVRPIGPHGASSDDVWTYNDKSIVQQSTEAVKTRPAYTFDRVYNENETNYAIFRDSAMDIVKSVLQGINGTIFTYGQTASGKTFTMCGNDQSPGIILLAIEKVFDCVKNTPDQKFVIHVGYIEIYNEVVTDLLNPENTNLKIHENPSGDICVGQLTEEQVTEVCQVTKLLNLGEQNRKVGNTNMTERSSRSHTIFRIKIKSQQQSIDRREEDVSGYKCDRFCDMMSSSSEAARDRISTEGSADRYRSTRTSFLNLVDLAGSERALLTGAEGVRLKEGSHINKSLLALKRVISTLAEKKNVSHVPFRDSKLTRILQPALGGNSRTAIICTITPSPLYQEESHTTLEFADNVRKIRTKPRVNESTLEFTNLIKRINASKLLSHEIGEMSQATAGRDAALLPLRLSADATDQVVEAPGRKVVKERPRGGSEMDGKKGVLRALSWQQNRPRRGGERIWAPLADAGGCTGFSDHGRASEGDDRTLVVSDRRRASADSLEEESSTPTAHEVLPSMDGEEGSVSAQGEELSGEIASSCCLESFGVEFSHELDSLDMAKQGEELCRLRDALSAVHNGVRRLWSDVDASGGGEEERDEEERDGCAWASRRASEALEVCERLQIWWRDESTKRRASEETRLSAALSQTEEALADARRRLESIEEEKRALESSRLLEEESTAAATLNSPSRLLESGVEASADSIGAESEWLHRLRTLVDQFESEETRACAIECVDAVGRRWGEQVRSLVVAQRTMQKTSGEEGLGDELSSSDAMKSSPQEGMANLENQLELVRQRYREEHIEKEKMQGRLQDAMRRLEASERREASLRGESEMRSTQCLNSENLNSRWQNEIERLESELSESRESYRTLKVSYDAELARDKHRIADLEVRQGASDKKLAASEERVMHQDEELSVLNAELKELKGRVCKGSARSSESDERIDRQLRQIAALEHKVRVQDGSIDEAQARVASLVASEERLMGRVDALNRESLSHRDMEQRRVRLEKQYEELKSRFDNLSVSAARASEFECRLEASLKREEKLKGEVWALHSCSNEYKEYRMKQERLVSDYEERLRRASKELEAWRERGEENNEDSTTRLKRLESELSSLKHREKSDEQVLGESRAEVARLRDQLEERASQEKSVIDEQRQSLIKLRDENHRMLVELDRARLDLFNARDKLYDGSSSRDDQENVVNGASCAKPFWGGVVKSSTSEDDSLMDALDAYMKTSDARRLSGSGASDVNHLVLRCAEKLRESQRVEEDLRNGIVNLCKTKEYTEACWQTRCNKLEKEAEVLRNTTLCLKTYSQRKKQAYLELEKEAEVLRNTTQYSKTYSQRKNQVLLDPVEDHRDCQAQPSKECVVTCTD